MIILSTNKRIAEKRATKIIFKDFIVEIVLNGLSTLKDLSELKFIPEFAVNK